MQTNGFDCKSNKLQIYKLVVIFIFLLAIVGAFARTMTLLCHNEDMYICAGILVAQGYSLYQDFAYLQTPYLALLYGGLFKLFDSFYLLIGKIVSFLFLVISSVIIFLIARRLLKSNIISLAVATLFLLNGTIVNAAAEVSNYIMPLAFSLLSFYVFVVSTENKIRPFGIAVCGFFLAIAMGAKLTYASCIIPFVLTSLFYPHFETIKRRILYVLFPLVAGITVGLLPMMFFFFSDIHAFLFNNIGYHQVTAKWRQITEFAGPMLFLSKLSSAHRLFFHPDNLIILLGIALAVGFSITRMQAIWCILKQIPPGVFLAFLLVFITLSTALVPTPPFPQYFAIPISFLFILLVYSLTSPEILPLLRKLLVILMIVSLCNSGPHVLKNFLKLTHKDSWMGLHVHDVSMKVKNIIKNKITDTSYKIATLSPIFVVDANIPIYLELSTGPFLYRVGDLLTSQERKRFVGTSPKSIATLLDREPPVAIIVGFKGVLDEPFIEYAKANNYVKVDIPGFGGQLYVRS